MSFVFNNLNHNLLLKRFREQILFDRFEGLDIKGEIIHRIEKAGLEENKRFVDMWVDQLKNGKHSDLNIRSILLKSMGV